MQRPRLSYKLKLPGGQDRLRELILYVSERCADAPRFGKVKLNKILWKADFEAFAKRGVPVTGRSYQRLSQGPAPVDMPPLMAEMVADGILDFVLSEFAPGVVEERPVAKRKPKLRTFFSEDYIRFVDAAIEHFWSMTAAGASDDSHGIAWKSRRDMDPMPYEAAYLSDDAPPELLVQKMRKFAEEAGLRSR